MADEANENETPDTDTETETVETPKDKTFTQSEVEAMMAGRLSSQEKTLKKQFAEESKKQSERAKLEESERLKADMADLEKERDEALGKAKRAAYKSELKGEVADIDTALLIVANSDEKYLKDGAIDIKTLLRDKPFLNPTKQPSAPPGGGAQPEGSTDPMSSLAAAQAADAKAGR